MVVRDLGEGDIGVTANGPGVSFFGYRNVLELDTGESCTTL